MQDVVTAYLGELRALAEASLAELENLAVAARWGWRRAEKPADLGVLLHNGPLRLHYGRIVAAVTSAFL